MRRYVNPKKVKSKKFKPKERPSVKSVTEDTVRGRFIFNAMGVAKGAKALCELTPSRFKIEERAAAKKPA
jgi:hypothetical protein